MIADVDDPRPSRARGFVIGTLIAAPFALLFLWFAVSVLPRAILDTAVDFDSRLRQEEAYMNAVCGELSDETLARDESLCECVLAVEYPGIDCRMPFQYWTLQRMTERCADPATHESARSFCTCVQTLDGELSTLRPDSKDAREIVQRYDRCTELEDALFLPTPDELATVPAP